MSGAKRDKTFNNFEIYDENDITLNLDITAIRGQITNEKGQFDLE